MFYFEKICIKYTLKYPEHRVENAWQCVISLAYGRGFLFLFEFLGFFLDFPLKKKKQNSNTLTKVLSKL